MTEKKEATKERSRKEELQRRRREGAMRKFDYENAKRKVLHLEKDNYGYIFILETTDGWYKIMSHSALIYIHYVWPLARDKLNLTTKAPNLIADSDFRDKAPIGIVTRKDISEFEKILKAVGAKEVSTSGQNSESVTAYKLERPITESEFWRIKKEEDDLWSKANTVITPKEVYPNLAIDIQEVEMQIYFVARKMQRTDREFFGAEMLSLAKTLAKGVIMAEKGYLRWEEFFEAVPGKIADLYANISLISNFRLIDNKVLIRLNDLLLKVEADLKLAERDYEKKRKDRGSNKAGGKSEAGRL